MSDKSSSPSSQGSGELGAFQSLELHNVERGPTTAAGANVFFARISPDARPGMNTLTISGLPAGTRGISAWMTEWILPNNPHAGGATFTTTSVQLYNNGTQCRVKFSLDWSGSLPAAVQCFYA